MEPSQSTRRSCVASSDVEVCLEGPPVKSWPGLGVKFHKERKSYYCIPPSLLFYSSTRTSHLGCLSKSAACTLLPSMIASMLSA